MQQKIVFVTVGSTQFNDLIKAVDLLWPTIKENGGYNNIIYQIGSGQYEPSNGEFFRYKPSLKENQEQASLIICHCGAGTLLDCLRLGKQIIVVNNDTLMDNHQMELLNELVDKKYILGFNSVDDLKTNISSRLKELDGLTEYKRPTLNKIDDIIKQMF